MSAVLFPFGLKPVYHPSGLEREVRFDASFWTGTTNNKFYNTATTFYEFMPVTISAAGVVDSVGVVAAAGSANVLTTTQQIYGVFMGAEYTTPTGERRVTKYFVDGLATNLGESLTQFWINTDPEIVYEVQANGSVANGAVGGVFTLVNNAAGVTIGAGGGAGFSTAAINNTEVTGGNYGQVRCVGLGRTVAIPGTVPNLWGDAFTVLQVKIAANSFVAPKPNLN